MNELLKAEHLSVSFFTDAGEVEAVRDVSFTVEKGEVLAIVGESGCGKSALCKSIMKLLPKTAKIKSGKILVNGADITDYTEKNMSWLLGELFSMVFQDPMTSLNPTITVGKQIGEAVRIHNKKMSAMGLVQLLLAGIVMVINQKFFISGFKSLWHRSPNMDTLVAMGSMASFLWSVYVLFAMTRAQVDGNMEAVMDYMMNFYFESAAMILTLITVGKMLEARSKGKTRPNVWRKICVCFTWR